MVKQEHLDALMGGRLSWADWRSANTGAKPDLSYIDLSRRDLSGYDLHEADLRVTNLANTNLSDCDLREAKLLWANLEGATLDSTNFGDALLYEADLPDQDLTSAMLDDAVLENANLARATFKGSELTGTEFVNANLEAAEFSDAVLTSVNFSRANLTRTDFTNTDLRGCTLDRATLIETVFRRANLSECTVYGVSAWDVDLEAADQSGLILSSPSSPGLLAVDNLEVAQFVYLLLHNEKIRDVIDTIGEKGVLILGRFGDRKQLLDKLRIRLRELGFAPMVFDFQKPESKDFTETIRTLAGMSAFIVADITKPKSVPQEAQAVVPDYMVPFVPVIEEGEEPWAMFQDLWVKHREWVFEPLEYGSIDELVPKLGTAVVEPALQRRKALLARRAEEMGKRSLDDYAADAELTDG